MMFIPVSPPSLHSCACVAIGMRAALRLLLSNRKSSWPIGREAAPRAADGRRRLAVKDEAAGSTSTSGNNHRSWNFFRIYRRVLGLLRPERRLAITLARRQCRRRGALLSRTGAVRPNRRRAGAGRRTRPPTETWRDSVRLLAIWGGGRHRSASSPTSSSRCTPTGWRIAAGWRRWRCSSSTC